MRVKTKRTISLLTVLIITVLTVSGCGAHKANRSANMMDGGYATGGGAGGAGMPEAKIGAASKSVASFDSGIDTGEMEFAEESAVFDYAAENGAGNEAGTTNKIELTEEQKKETKQKLIYNADISFETTEYESFIKSIKEKISEFNGIITNESESDNDYQWYYKEHQKNKGTLSLSITIRIPTKDFYKFIDSIEGEQAKTTDKSIFVTDITKSYSDKETTIASLEIQEERLLDMMKEAKRVSDMLEIENRLTEVQRELKQAKTDLGNMDYDTEYSTINMYVYEVLEYIPDDPTYGTVSFGERLRRTLHEAKESFLQTMEGVLFFFIMILPYIIIGLIAGIIIYKVGKVKKNKKKLKAKEAEKDIGKTDVESKNIGEVNSETVVKNVRHVNYQEEIKNDYSLAEQEDIEQKEN